MGLLTRLLGPRAAGRPKRPAPAKRPAATKSPADAKQQARKADQPAQPAGRSLIYSVRRRVVVSLRRGWKRKTTRNTTTEWRHGNCPIKHRSRQAAARCRNA